MSKPFIKMLNSSNAENNRTLDKHWMAFKENCEFLNIYSDIKNVSLDLNSYQRCLMNWTNNSEQLLC